MSSPVAAVKKILFTRGLVLLVGLGALLGCTTSDHGRTVDSGDTGPGEHTPAKSTATSESHSDEDRASLSCDDLQRQADAEELLFALLEKELPEELRVLIEEPEAHRLQILVGQVVETTSGDTCLIEHGLRVDAEYFYPASSVKTLASIAALQLASEYEGAPRPELDLDDIIWLRERDDPNDRYSTFTSKPAGTLRNLVEEAQIISSNQAYNHLFDLVGHERLNQAIRQAGLKSTRLQHRFFSQRTPEQERWSPAVSIQQGSYQGATQSETDNVQPDLHPLLPARQSTAAMPPLEINGIQVGSSYIEGREIRHQPMDFSPFNYFSLADHLHLMAFLFRPDLTKIYFQGLSSDHLSLLTDAMVRDPLEYRPNLGAGAQRRFKPALSGVEEILPPERVRYSNKGGRAYGFHIENAYILDTHTGRDVFLAVVVYVNQNQRLNDNTYEYDELSFPFLQALGAIVARQFLALDDTAMD